MTKFEQFELVYNQFTNLTKEINEFIDMEEYDIANEKLSSRNKLVQKLFNIKKTINLSEEDSQKLILIEREIKENEYKNLEALKKKQCELGAEIKNTKKKVKVSAAYNKNSSQSQGIIFDAFE